MMQKLITLAECEAVLTAKPEFKKYTKNGYVVFDYMLNNSETFNCSVSKEMRGIAFDPITGECVSRPFHKFHNLNENLDYTADKFDFGQGHVIMDKLDGSMIRTIKTKTGFVLGTRAGETDVSRDATKSLTVGHVDLINQLIDQWTLMFEYVGPDNQIVLFYNEPKLILTAIRNNTTGQYVSFEDLRALAQEYNVPLVDVYQSPSSINELSAFVKDWKGVEGVVVRFDDGQMVKIKAEEYVLQHRAVSNIVNEKDVVKMLIDNTLDDVIPLLSADRQTQIKTFADSLNAAISGLSQEIFDLFVSNFVPDRKEFAAFAVTTDFSQFMFKLHSLALDPNRSLANRSPIAVVTMLREQLVKHCSSGPKLQEFKQRIGLDVQFKIKQTDLDG